MGAVMMINIRGLNDDRHCCDVFEDSSREMQPSMKTTSTLRGRRKAEEEFLIIYL